MKLWDFRFPFRFPFNCEFTPFNICGNIIATNIERKHRIRCWVLCCLLLNSTSYGGSILLIRTGGRFVTEQRNAWKGGNDRDSAVAELIEPVQSQQTKDYISRRIIPQMQWYGRKSRECQQKYYRWTAAVILLSAMIPIASVFADGALWGKTVIAALGAIVTMSNSFLALYNYKDLWLSYQNKHEVLLHILYCYFTNAGIFTKNASQAEKDLTLVNTCEAVLSYEIRARLSAVKK